MGSLMLNQSNGSRMFRQGVERCKMIAQAILS